MAEITVIIPNYKGIKFIENCLASLYDQVEGTPEYEVLVVDNASKDGSVEVIQREFPQTRLICLKENTGFCHAVNVGIKNSDSPFVLLLNNDVKVYRDFILRLYEGMGTRLSKGRHGLEQENQQTATANSRQAEDGLKQENQQTATANSRQAEDGLKQENQQTATGSSQLANDGLEHGKHAGDELIFSVSAAMLAWDQPELMDDAGDQYNLLGWAYARGKGKAYKNYQKRCKVFSACGGAALYRRAVFDKIGLFDENHFAYLEDLDVGYRARIYGYENVYEPAAKVIHYGSAATGSRYNEWKTKRAAANNVYVIAKNQPLAFKIMHFPFLLAGFCIKQAFFIKKGMGKQYFLGVLEGIRLSVSAEGSKHRVPYKRENLRNYLKIELKMIAALLKPF